PGAGVHGGNVVVSGYLDELLTAKHNDSDSLTLAYLRGEKVIEVPKKRREPQGKISIKGGNIFNIKDMNVDIPLRSFNVITGVSGSGKSSLLYEILYKNLQGRLERRHRTASLYNCTSFTGS